MTENQKLPITPKTRVGELLENYPELEDVLLELSPAFKKLKNPVLRKTVGKVATLQQAAAVGNLTVTEVINTLRTAAGQQLFEGESSAEEINYSKPDWFIPEKVAVSFDASTIINSGQNPMAEILNQLDKSGEGEIFMLTTPFVPAPIIELIGKKGYEHYCISPGQDTHHSYFFIPGS